MKICLHNSERKLALHDAIESHEMSIDRKERNIHHDVEHARDSEDTQQMTTSIRIGETAQM